jgi:hypothetical protein
VRTYERRPIGHSLEVHGANRHISKQSATPEKNAQRSYQGCQTQCATTVAKFEAGEFGVKTAGRWPARVAELAGAHELSERLSSLMWTDEQRQRSPMPQDLGNLYIEADETIGNFLRSNEVTQASWFRCLEELRDGRR